MALHQMSDEATNGHRPAEAARCFIAVRPGVDISPLRSLLAERKIDAVASYERPWLGARPLDTVMALIEDADLVIGILDEQADGANIAFELGYAFARDKKMMVIVPRGASMPSDLSSTVEVRADVTETEAIAFNLDILMAAPPPKRRPYLPAAATTQAIGPLADQLIERLDTALAQGDSAGLERLVGDLLRASGVDIARSADELTAPDTGPDFGVWSDDLESSVGNPFLIEVKLRIPSRSVAKAIRQQAKSYVRLRSRDWGLVLYGEGPPAWEPAVESEPPILIIGIRDMIERLRTEGFGAIIGSLRDQAIKSS